MGIAAVSAESYRMDLNVASRPAASGSGGSTGFGFQADSLPVAVGDHVSIPTAWEVAREQANKWKQSHLLDVKSTRQVPGPHAISTSSESSGQVPR